MQILSLCINGMQTVLLPFQKYSEGLLDVNLFG